MAEARICYNFLLDSNDKLIQAILLAPIIDSGISIFRAINFYTFASTSKKIDL